MTDAISDKIRTEMISVQTDDGISLSGVLWIPARGASHTAVTLFPGTGEQFYKPLFVKMGQQLAAAGYMTLAMNRRDHGQYFGFYSLHDASMDQRYAIELLTARGAAQVVLGGHSYGTVTAPYYIAETNDARVPGLLMLAILGDMRRGSILMLGGEGRYNAVVAEAKAKVAAGEGDTAFLIPPMVPGETPIPHSYGVFLDKRGPDSRAVPIELIKQVGDRPLFGVRDPAEPLPATLPPAQEMLQAANNNLEYVLLDDIRHGETTKAAHSFEDREDEVVRLVLNWLTAQGFAP